MKPRLQHRNKYLNRYFVDINQRDYLDKDVVELFCKLVSIPSPSGKESNAIKFVQGYLKNIGIKSYTDSAGKRVASNSGNLIAKLGNGKSKIMFVTHIDTVEDGEKAIKPLVKNGIIKSDGTTILGSDDKGGVAALLAAIREVRFEKNLPTTLCVFTVREEDGVMGVNYLKTEKDVDFVFDVDGSNPPGQFINKALGNTRFEVQIYGRETHAAAAPAKGSNAIRAAGIALSGLKLGRDLDWHVLNIGTISGGTRDNVVPGKCIMTGEARAFTLGEMDEMLKRVEKVVSAACKSTGCKYKLIKKDRDPPLYTRETEKIVALARKASTKAGIKFSLLKIPATLQGNHLSAKGYSVLGLSKGGKSPHSKRESLLTSDLEQTKRLIVEIIRCSSLADVETQLKSLSGDISRHFKKNKVDVNDIESAIRASQI